MPDTPSPITGCLFVLFVADQRAAATYYSAALGTAPTLDVPGMTRFQLSEGADLGLMPETGIAALVPNMQPPAHAGHGIARSEVYLTVPDPQEAHRRALAAGGRELSALAPRPWGDEAAYSQCPDGHLLIFARALADTDASGSIP